MRRLTSRKPKTFNVKATVTVEKETKKVTCSEPCPIVVATVEKLSVAATGRATLEDERHAAVKTRLEYGNALLSKIGPMETKLDGIQFWARTGAGAALTAVLAAVALFAFDLYKHEHWEKKTAQTNIFRVPPMEFTSLSQP